MGNGYVFLSCLKLGTDFFSIVALKGGTFQEYGLKTGKEKDILWVKMGERLNKWALQQ